MVSSRYTQLATRPRFIVAILLIYNLILDIVGSFLPRSLRKEPKSLKDQNVLVTGAACGVGQLLAIRFLRLGARVVMWDVNVAGMEQTRAMAQQEGLPAQQMMHAYRVDLTNRSEIYRTADLVLKEIGTIDVLVNNAGLLNGNFFLDIPDDRMEATFRVNVFAHFYTIKAFLPSMIAEGRGHLVTMASSAGEIPAIQLTDYCASKFACVGLESSLRLELTQAGLDDQISMTVVKPFHINTTMATGAHSDLIATLEPDYVADKVIDAVLYDRQDVILPWYLSILALLATVLSKRSYALINELGGGFDFMAKFTGKQLEMETIKEESMEATEEKEESIEEFDFKIKVPTINIIETVDQRVDEETLKETNDSEESIFENTPQVVEVNGNGNVQADHQRTSNRKHSNGSKKRRGSKSRGKANGNEYAHAD